jgi:hypothetical protein
VLLGFGIAWVAAYLVVTHVQGTRPNPFLAGRERSPLYGLWTVEMMALDGEEVPMTDATRWRDFAIDRGTVAWSRELTGERHYLEFQWDEASSTAQVKERGALGPAGSWTVERGTDVVKSDPPLLLRNEDRGKKVDVERRYLSLQGRWRGKDLELYAIEKVFRLQTSFRLRQELPDFW